MTPDWLRESSRRTRGVAPTAARTARSARPSAAAKPVAMTAAPNVITAAAMARIIVSGGSLRLVPRFTVTWAATSMLLTSAVNRSTSA